MKHGSTETKQQFKKQLPCGSSGPIKFKSERSVNKVMATVFWDSEGVMLVDFLEGKKTVKGAYYIEVLRKLRAKLAAKASRKTPSWNSFPSQQCPSAFFSDHKRCFE